MTRIGKKTDIAIFTFLLFEECSPDDLTGCIWKIIILSRMSGVICHRDIEFFLIYIVQP